ncbi:hypothetical protein Mnod_2632 [Methylobacterium nodulans ORS 2060]|uniref:Peptidase S24/S26A/S26B/S26C domain-containing protein n=1 Tax=Methylobacterium nodulans (strain LMG 21967 / CNCM I-2342 / ORS 2060) TaxID=460265 RepID=B8IE49_METNO|nr:hypothetical protein Mnod_2632 [Methylobacterium nodulans ORS 2060]
MQELEELIHVPSIPHPEYAGLKQYAWRVEGTSMNRVVKAGSYVIGVAFADMPRRIQHRDLVVCQRRDHDRYEYTLKRVAITDVGIRLDPESDDPAWQDPVWLSSGETGGIEVEATHLIIGTFSFLV